MVDEFRRKRFASEVGFLSKATPLRVAEVGKAPSIRLTELMKVIAPILKTAMKQEPLDNPTPEEVGNLVGHILCSIDVVKIDRLMRDAELKSVDIPTLEATCFPRKSDDFNQTKKQM